MAEFLTTKKTVSMIEDIICSAQSTLVLISPYWKLSSNLFERISEAAQRTPVQIVFGKTYKPETLGSLPSIKNISISFLMDLHAKCYFNQDSMVISSMNIYEYSENNREMGIYIKKDVDRQLFDAARKEAEHFLQHAIPLSGSVSENHAARFNTATVQSIETYTKVNGACIRCGSAVKYNPMKPLCSTCYNSWSKWGNEGFAENYCHCCGREADTNMAHPECHACYKQHSKKVGGGF